MIGDLCLQGGNENMNTVGRTIQIYLPNGDQLGIRVAEITTSVLRMIEIPRNQLDFLQHAGIFASWSLFSVFRR